MDPGDRRIAWRLALLLAVALTLFHRGHFMSTDELGVFFQTQSLARAGSFAVPDRVHLSFRGADGRTYSQYVAGQSLLAVPFYAAGALALPHLSVETRRTLAGPVGAMSWAGEPPVGARAFAVLFYPPAVAGALAGLFYLMERALGASRRGALAASLALALCTHAALFATLFLQHGTEALFALGAFFFWHRFRTGGGLADVAWGSACASALFNVRAAAAVSGLALGGYLAFAASQRARVEGARLLARVALAAAAPLALGAALYVAINHAKWGLWLDSPQLGERATFGHDPRPALRGFLLSPGMSAFVYTPLLALAPWTFARFAARWRAEAATIAVLCATTLAFYASYELWTGLFSCPGPRYLFVPMVFALLPLGPWLDAARSRASRAAFAALAAAGAAVQGISILVQWGRLTAVEGYYAWQPPFHFVFEWRAAPVVRAAAHLFEPAYWDLWLARTAQGWPGQAPRPVLAAALLAAWAALVALLAWRLRVAVASAGNSRAYFGGPARRPMPSIE